MVRLRRIPRTGGREEGNLSAAPGVDVQDDVANAGDTVFPECKTPVSVVEFDATRESDL